MATPTEQDFERFVDRVQPSLQRALSATYGADVGRVVTLDALSWAWEHWDRVLTLDRPVGYLYRVGQSASRRLKTQPIPPKLLPEHARMPDVEPGLVAAVEDLPERQRTVVVLVHAFGWRQSEVAELLDVSAGTVARHLQLGLDRLRSALQGPANGDES